eukprot:12933882-Prorocentrum_lima.AAC.1
MANPFGSVLSKRLTAHGFKDMQACAANIKICSATLTTSAQRAVNVCAEQTGYVLFSMEVSAALLK